jgi:hypothetical protein
MNDNNTKNLIDFDSPTKSIITMEELDKLNDEYFKELFNSVPFFHVNESKIDSETQNQSEVQTDNKFNILNYVKLPLLFNMFQQPELRSVEPIKTEKEGKSTITKLDNKSRVQNDKILFVNKIKKNASDPLSIIIVLIFSIFFYIYFANEFVYQVLGLFYPTYYLYTLMHYRNTNYREKIRSIIKYFIIYGHIEFISSLLKLVGIYFYHLKILVIICALYITGYRQEWLNSFYDNMIFYDRVILDVILTTTNKFYEEYTRIKSDTINNSKRKAMRKKN